VADLLYLIGQPGSGKSTLAAALTDGLDWIESTHPFAHRACLAPGGTVVELGARREKFSGTDALSMNVQPKVVEWLGSSAPGLVLGEGDRLANDKFFKKAMGLGWNVRLAYLAVPSAVAEERRLARAAALGADPQGPVWVKGRVTKNRRLAETWASFMYRLDANQPTVKILADLIRTGDPVVSALVAARPPR
jgi:predicted ABC-type transport system involved in lysophospholipase L1 biosynthesis ATPase subunit